MSNEPGWYDVEDVKLAARGRWPGVLARFDLRVELLTGRHGPCPGCGGKDRFRFDDKEGDGTFICSQGGGGNLAGDGLTLLMHCTGWEWKKCIEEVGNLLIPHDRKHRGRRVVDEHVAREPVAEKGPKRPPFDKAKLERFIEGTPVVGRDYLRQRSKIPVEGISTADFFEALYGTDERVLLFLNEYSQGDFLYRVGYEGFRLAKERGVKAVRSELPTTGKLGVWFLTNPVTGMWTKGDPKPKWGEVNGQRVKLGDEEHWTRRAWQNVTSWRYMMLESDDAPEELWLRALIKMRLPIAAIYSSGKRSLHALIKVDAGSKLEWDAIKDQLIQPLFCPIGADGGALSAVRLSRAPQCFREGEFDKSGGPRRYVRYAEPRRQELLYLNDNPPMKSLMEMRGVHNG